MVDINTHIDVSIEISGSKTAWRIMFLVTQTYAWVWFSLVLTQ